MKEEIFERESIIIFMRKYEQLNYNNKPLIGTIDRSIIIIMFSIN